MSLQPTVNVRSEIREFLASRRARLSPDTVGIPEQGRPRRVPGLRREEVAVLAGVSAPYYARLERGDLVNASPDVLDAIGRALRLDESERTYLVDLTLWSRRRIQRDDVEGSHSELDRPQPRAELVNLLRAMTGVAGFLVNDHEEMLAANKLGHALSSPMIERDQRVNLARYVFLNPEAPTFFTDTWSAAATKASATLRKAMGRYPDDSRLATLIEDLSRRSDEFRRYWEVRDVALRSSEHRRYQHPLVGRIELNFERLALPQDPRLTLVTLGAPPDSRSARALAELYEREPPDGPETVAHPGGLS